MSRLRLSITMSLDGYMAGPQQSVDDPMGVGGKRLHPWVFELEAFRRMHGLPGGETNDSSIIVNEQFDGVGASILGRNMFGGQPGAWDATAPWNGWWGPTPPFHHPVFVLTHHARAPLVMEGGTTFTFVTDGIHAALAQARDAARGLDISLGGGPHTIQQYFRAGLVDRMDITIVPTLLGAGERLFEGTGDDLHGLAHVRTIVGPRATHFRYDRA
jgi:dihydrofolate reductase